MSAAICAMAAAPLLFTQVAMAQEKPTSMLEEVVVTARKRSESAMDVPVSISALSEDQLQAAGVFSIDGLFALIPGVQNNADGSRIANKPAIRGVGSTENSSIRAKVTTFIDGMPIVGAQGISSFIGLQQVEVLRGPQSAAFGRSTFGGAINYITRDPGDELEVNLRGTLAQDNAYNASAVLSTPVIEDKLGVLVTLQESNYDGDSKWQTTSGHQLGGTNDKLATIKLAFTPTDSLSGELMYMYTKVDDDEPPILFANLDQLVPYPKNPSGTCAINGGKASCVILGEIDKIPQVYDYDYDNPNNPINNPGTRIERDRYSGSLTMDFDNGWSLTGLGSYTDETADSWFDRDTFTGGNAIHAGSTPESDEKYGELRLASSPDNRLNWLIGASIYDYDYTNTVFNNVTAGIIMDLFTESATNIGGFFNLTYEVTDKLVATLEGRYQSDEITGTYPANPGRGVPSPIKSSTTTDTFLPRYSLRYDLTDEMNIYAQVAKGNNPAGYNTNALDPILLQTAAAENYDLPAYQTFDEEEIWSYELGLKGESSEYNTRYSVAVYYLDWTGYVQPVTANWTPADGELLPGTTPNDYFSRLFISTGDLDGYGAEIEGSWAPTERLVMGVALAYSGIEFTNGSCSPIPLDYGEPPTRTEPFACAPVDGDIPPMLSEYTASTHATYTYPLGDYDAYGRIDYQYASKRYVEQINTDYLPSYDIVNIRAGLRSDVWQVELFVDNLFDQDSPAGGGRFFDNRLPGMTYNSTVRPRRPQSVGITLAYNFR